MPNNLTRLEAIATRRHLAATTPRERGIRALVLMCLQAARKQANSGEGATPVTVSPVGAFSGLCAFTPPPLDPRPDVARAGGLSLDPVPLPSEISAPPVSAAECQPGGRGSEPKFACTRAEGASEKL